MHSEIASAGSKRLVGIDPLDDEHDEGIGNYWTGIVAILHDRACLRSCFDRAGLRGDARGESGVFMRVPACSKLVVVHADAVHCGDRHGMG